MNGALWYKAIMLEAAHFKNLEAIITFCRIIIHFQKRGFVLRDNKAVINHFLDVLFTAPKDDNALDLIANVCG